MDGGRSAAQWFLYQYVRTLEALLDAAGQESVGAVHVEGRRSAADEPAAEGVDYELTDHAGRTLVAVQVKGRGPSGKFRATDLFRAVSKLVHDREAPRYQIIVNAALGESADAFIAAIGEAADAGELRDRLDRVLSSARASQAKASLQNLPDRDLDRMRRAEVVVDRREDEEIHEILRARLRRYRNAHRAGLGNESAGLMAGYLISEIFRSAADAGRAEFTIAKFRSMLLADSATLRSALGHRDWGVVIGMVPAWPDIYRGEVIERIVSALPCRNDVIDVRRCALVGMSGIGKSSIAAGYILDRADLYDAIYWVDAESDPALHVSFTQILAHLSGGDDDAAADSAWLRSRVHSLLARSAGRWLLVFDNGVEPRSVEPWIPRAGNGHVIVTSTDSAQPSGPGAKIDVGPMSPAEALTLLKRRLHVGENCAEDHALLTRLADAMERWPLALELAAAYLDAGMGIGGIPDYLATLKVRSLDDRRSRPPGYPRTLVEAVYLCVERIEGLSQRPSDPAGVAASGIWFAAYLSGRRIPAHLLVTCVLMAPQMAGGFKAASPMYMSATVCPTPEMVSFLRSESLVNLDEPLPAEGLTEPGLPDTTVSVNTVLQEVLRERRDADPRIGEHLLGRAAYHINLWMAKAHEYGDFPRTLAFAAHATAIEQHAARLGVSNDYIAYMRGNLAGVLQRRGDHAKAETLLREEISHLDGRTEEHCIVGCCQARIMLAAILADKEPPAAPEILELLGNAYPVLQARAVTAPSRVTEIAISAQQVLHRTLTPHWGLDGHLTHNLSQLDAVVADLIRHMPQGTITAAVRILENAENSLHEDPQVTVSLCRSVLGQAWDDAGELNVRQLRQDAQRLVIEALVDLQDYAGAARELPAFLSMTEPAEPYAAVREKLVHNAGRAVGFAWLTADQTAPELTGLLQMMTVPELLEPIKSAFPGRTAARMRLLQAVRALADGDQQAASAHMKAARTSLPEPGSAVSLRDLAWTVLKSLITAALEGDENTEGRSPQRQDRPWSGRDLSRFIAPDLLGRGLPGPRRTWLRRPHPGEVDMVNGLLNHADDELGPWAAEAIDSGTLSSLHHGVFYGRPLDELAGELSQGGPGTLMSGFTIVLVAVDPGRTLVGAVQAAPPFELLTSIRGMSRDRMLAATHVMMKITGVGVMPSRRGAGVGRALTKSAADLAWRIGYRVVYGQFGISSGLDKFFSSCGFDIVNPSDGITFTPYDVPFGIMPQPGNQFFASRYDEGM